MSINLWCPFPLRQMEGMFTHPPGMWAKTIWLHILLSPLLFQIVNPVHILHLKSLSPWRTIVDVDRLKLSIGLIFKKSKLRSWLASSPLLQMNTRHVGMLLTQNQVPCIGKVCNLIYQGQCHIYHIFL